MRTFVLLICMAFITQGNAMSFFSSKKELTWEWPDGRKSAQHVMLKLDKVKKPSKLIDSPSFANHIPNAVELEGKIVAASLDLGKKNIELKVPGDEVEGLAEGQHILLGLDDENIVICTKTVPTELASEDDLKQWFEQQRCD